MFRTGNDDLDAPSILVKEDGLRSIYSMEPLDKKIQKACKQEWFLYFLNENCRNQNVCTKDNFFANSKEKYEPQ